MTEADSHTLTVVGTADLHGHLLDWDYHRDRPYHDAWGNSVGLARVADVVRRERAAGRASVLVDAGDFLQGTPLASYAIERLRQGQPHPLASAMNALGFDAAVVGNHEFDFGLDMLRSFERQVAFPLLAANVADRAADACAFTPYVVCEVDVPLGPPVRVGIIGLAHPGTAVWNGPQTRDALRFDDLVVAAERWVPRVRAAGADVVIVVVHAYDGVERIAEQVAGIDAILAGHEHGEVESRTVMHAATGQLVVVTMPMCWGMRVSTIAVTVTRVSDRYRVVDRRARLLDTADAEDAPEIVRLVESDHRAVIEAGREVIGSSRQRLDGDDPRWRPSPLVSLVQHVQAESIAGQVDDLPILSVASVPHHAIAFSGESITARDIETLAGFDNRIFAVRMAGAEVRAHLETAARYFATPMAVGPTLATQLTNAPTEFHPTGTPDYAYDSIAGYLAPLAYEIDVARPPGERIRSFTYDGEPVDDEFEFAVAMSSYRRTGAHGYTEAVEAPLLYEGGTGLRVLLTEWTVSNSPITTATFHRESWRLTYDGVVLDVVEDEVNP